MAAPSGAWQQQLAGMLGINLTPQVNQYFNAWAQAEGGGATNNPFNTTMPGYGATGNYNSIGVKNYADPTQGLKATAATLMNGKYGNIMNALKQGNNARQMALALANSPWGTGALVLKVLGGGGQLGQGAPTPPQAPAQGPQQPSLPSITKTMWDPLGPKGANLRKVFALSAPQSNLGAMANLGGTAAKIANMQKQAGDIPLPQPIMMPHVSAGNQPVAFQGMHGVQNDPQEAKAATVVKQYLGTPYVWGGAKPGGFDCSGLVQYCYSKVGIGGVPRTTYEQWDQGTPVSKKGLRPGDAVFFTGSDPKNGKPGHEGMYIGNGKFIEAPHTGGVVQVSSLAGRKDYVGARRF